MTFKPKVNGEYRHIEVDLRRNDESGSAVNQFVDDPNTEVYYGKIHARVTFFDLELRIIMDPAPGNWKDAEWARGAAFTKLKEDLSPELFGEILECMHERGRVRGSEQTRAVIREALGIKNGRYL